MRGKYSFVMEYRDKKDGIWRLNTLPLFPNIKYNKEVNISAGNLPFTMFPQIPFNKYMAATLAPINKQIEVSTPDLSFPEDMDPLSQKFLDMDAEYCGTINPHQMKRFKYEDIIVGMDVFVTPEDARAYRLENKIPDKGYLTSRGVPSDYKLIYVYYPLSKLTGTVEYFYTKVEKTLTTSYNRYVKDPFTDTRLIYTVSVV